MINLRWRRGTGSYHYYEDGIAGWGYAHRAAGGGWFAATTEASTTKPTLREAKRFVERAMSKTKAAKKSPPGGKGT